MNASAPLLLLLPALAGCHLFADGTIPCTSDELPECAEGDADTDADADTDTDTDADMDTDADADPVIGVAMVGDTPADDRRWFGAWAPDGSETLVWEGIAVQLDGPVVYDPASQRFWVSDDAYLYAVESSGSISTYGPFDDTLRDLALLDGTVYAATGDALYAVDTSQGANQLTKSSSLVNLDSVFVGDTSTLYLVDHGAAGEGPSLYTYGVSSGELGLAYGAYDTTIARSVDGFLGPAGQPFVCSKGGGAFAVQDIYDTPEDQSGNKAVLPERLATGSPTDIVDCGYDPSTDEVIFVSLTQGALRVGATGVTVAWVPLSGGDVGVRGSTFAP